MGCEEFLASYSDYRDGDLSDIERAALHAHVKTCACCRRYDRVMQRGLDMLHALSPTQASADFSSRLQHLLYHVDTGSPFCSQRFRGSAALVGVAAVGLVALFWLPFATHVPVELALPPVAVEAPEPPEATVPPLFRPGPFVTGASRYVGAEMRLSVADWPGEWRKGAPVVLSALHRRTESVSAR